MKYREPAISMDKPLPDLRAVPARVYAMHGTFPIVFHQLFYWN